MGDYGENEREHHIRAHGRESFKRFRDVHRGSKFPEWSEPRNKHCWHNQEFINEFLPGQLLVLLWKKQTEL